VTKKIAALATFALSTIAHAGMAAAAQPAPWQIWHQPAGSDMAARIFWFSGYTLFFIVPITIFVLALLIIVMVRYRASANPVASRTSHNSLIEVIWTVVPVIILIVIAIPSFKLLYYTDRVEKADMTLKVTGRQWYWDYEYPDHDGIAFSSYMIPEAKIDPAKGEQRLLSTDTKVVLPIETNIQIIVTGGDVIHSWAIPALGLKTDAIPGRLNETWVRIEKPGIYFGQCSELCGKDHAYMPIEIHAVTKTEFEAWVTKAKEEYAYLDPSRFLKTSNQFAQLKD
jgi:cytochrome c oxidase subunit 2